MAEINLRAILDLPGDTGGNEVVGPNDRFIFVLPYEMPYLGDEIYDSKFKNWYRVIKLDRAGFFCRKIEREDNG